MAPSRRDRPQDDQIKQKCESPFLFLCCKQYGSVSSSPKPASRQLDNNASSVLFSGCAEYGSVSSSPRPASRQPDKKCWNPVLFIGCKNMAPSVHILDRFFYHVSNKEHVHACARQSALVPPSSCGVLSVTEAQ